MTVRSTVPVTIYFGTGRGARRRVAKGLAELRALRDEAAPLREHIKARVDAVNALPKDSPERRLAATKLEAEFGPLLGLLKPLGVPVRLLACRECGRPTPECSCGLDWSTTAPSKDAT